jgi:hypothetical protein
VSRQRTSPERRVDAAAAIEAKGCFLSPEQVKLILR